MEYDVVVVGAGPAGLAAAIRLKQLSRDLAVCIIEKGSEVGAHILSGAVFEPRALDELLPDWQSDGAPLVTPATDDRFLLLTERRAFRLPTPPQMRNHGNYIISLGNLCRWLAQKAEALGVEIYPGFAGDPSCCTRTAASRASQPARRASARTASRPPISSRASSFAPRKPCSPRAAAARSPRVWSSASSCAATAGRRPMASASRSYGRSPRAQHHPGRVVHTVGWPLDRATYGGSFLYHLENRQVAVGFVVGLDYAEPVSQPVRGVSALQDSSRDPRRPSPAGGASPMARAP